MQVSGKALEKYNPRNMHNVSGDDLWTAGVRRTREGGRGIEGGGAFLPLLVCSAL